MRRIPVDSSVLASVGYAPRSRVLEVEFRTGFVYQYFEVPRRIHEALMRASSQGSYFNRYIRDRFLFHELR